MGGGGRGGGTPQPIPLGQQSRRMPRPCDPTRRVPAAGCPPPECRGGSPSEEGGLHHTTVALNLQHQLKKRFSSAPGISNAFWANIANIAPPPPRVGGDISGRGGGGAMFLMQCNMKHWCRAFSCGGTHAAMQSVSGPGVAGGGGGVPDAYGETETRGQDRGVRSCVCVLCPSACSTLTGGRCRPPVAVSPSPPHHH